MIRVLLADDHPLTLEGLRSVLRPHVDCIGTVTDGRALVEAALRLVPDLIVLDITMPFLNGLDAAIQIRKWLPKMKFVFVTLHVSPSYVEAALNAGAGGFVLKSDAQEELIRAIRQVMAGKTYITQSLARSAGNPGVGSQPGGGLSIREREILQLVAEGRAAKEIAHILSISIKTVAFHRRNIKEKLRLHSTAELTKYAIEQGLV